MFPFLYLIALFKCIMPDFVQEIAVYSSRFCPVCKPCSLNIHFELHSPGLKTYYYDAIFHFDPILAF